MEKRIEVYPDKATPPQWRWRKKSANGRTTATSGESFSDRTAAFEGALLEREDEAIVLLRKDGSVYGELYHAAREGGPPQRVDILAATTNDNAEKVSANG